MRRTTTAIIASWFSSFFALYASMADAQQIRFTTENDIFGARDTKDDLYTFAVALDLHGERFDSSLRENAFTDRAAGVRFDETQLSVGRALPPMRGWTSYAEAGLVRVGRGIFGEDVQNAVHQAIGSDEVVLPYAEPSLHLRAALDADRVVAAGRSFAIGPRLELEWISGLRSHAVVAARAAWEPKPWLAAETVLGARFSDADFAPLEPHTQAFGAVLRLGVTVLDRIFFSWSKNDYGDGRSHVTVGYSFTNFRLGGTGPINN